MEKKIYGLSMQEVEEKRKKGEGEQEQESITKSKQIFIRLHVNCCNRNRSGYIFPSVYDGLGKSGTVHRHGIEQVHMSVYYHWYYHVQYGTDTYNGRF